LEGYTHKTSLKKRLLVRLVGEASLAHFGSFIKTAENTWKLIKATGIIGA